MSGMIGNDPARSGAKPLAQQSYLLGNPAVNALGTRYCGRTGRVDKSQVKHPWLLSRHDDPRFTHPGNFPSKSGEGRPNDLE